MVIHIMPFIFVFGRNTQPHAMLLNVYVTVTWINDGRQQRQRWKFNLLLVADWQ